MASKMVLLWTFVSVLCKYLSLLFTNMSQAYMNATTYDENSKIASVQPGSTWGESYAALDSYGVVNIGGRASIVGVGGFTTGGGVGPPSLMTLPFKLGFVS